MALLASFSLDTPKGPTPVQDGSGPAKRTHNPLSAQSGRNPRASPPEAAVKPQVSAYAGRHLALRAPVGRAGIRVILPCPDRDGSAIGRIRKTAPPGVRNAFRPAGGAGNVTRVSPTVGRRARPGAEARHGRRTRVPDSLGRPRAKRTAAGRPHPARGGRRRPRAPGNAAWDCSVTVPGRPGKDREGPGTREGPGVQRLRWSPGPSPRVAGQGFEPWKAKPTDLQSAPIGRSGNLPGLRRRVRRGASPRIADDPPEPEIGCPGAPRPGTSGARSARG